MNLKSLNCWDGLKSFDPEEGVVVMEPLGHGEGYWVGACSIVFDPTEQTYYLYYRAREPRPVRGGKCFVAQSKDGIKFETVWNTTKEALNTDSIEKGSLFRTRDGRWRLYLSYVDPSDQRWRVDLLEANHPSEFDIHQRTSILTARETGCEGVKDPFVMEVDGKIYMFLSYAPGDSTASETQQQEMHASSDIYNTGLSKSSSALAVSEDGIHFKWLGDIFAPGASGWDCHATRLGSVQLLPPLYLGFYDGGPSHLENYEEKTGLAVSLDLQQWHRITPEKPYLTSPHGSGSLRYLHPLELDQELRYYYEYARADGAHEIRMNRFPRH
ncbi:hypothetical protein N8703_03925 [Verrucomicrobia bacterium]|nr:hypothetical protein [Verrucomicrobiota bacterium]